MLIAVNSDSINRFLVNLNYFNTLDCAILKDQQFLMVAEGYVLGSNRVISHDSGFNASLLIVECGKG